MAGHAAARWLLLRDRRSLRAEQRVQLKELLAANQALFTVYVLNDVLKRLWHYKAPAAARRFWQSW